MDRATGDTFRKTLQVLHHISSYDKAYSLFVFGTNNARRYAVDRAVHIGFDCLRSYFTTDEKNFIRLGNDSVVRFITSSNIELLGWHGLNITQFVEDGSVDFQRRSNSYLEEAHKVRAVVERNFARIKDVSREID